MIDLRYESPDISGLDILALGAHPNHVELTCGGALRRMSVEFGHKTGILDLTTGDMSTLGLPEQRLESALRASAILQAAWRGNCRFPDARIDNTIAARMTLATIFRTLRPRVLILPYWQGRHPDYYRTSELGYEAAYLSGLAKLDEDSEPFRPVKVVYSAPVAKASFIVDITGHFEQRIEALFAYGELYPDEAGRKAVRDRLEAEARFAGSQIGVRYGEAFAVKEAIEVRDLSALGSPTF